MLRTVKTLAVNPLIIICSIVVSVSAGTRTRDAATAARYAINELHTHLYYICFGWIKDIPSLKNCLHPYDPPIPQL